MHDVSSEYERYYITQAKEESYEMKEPNPFLIFLLLMK